MDKDQALKEVRANIGAGKYELAGRMAMEIASDNGSDPMTLLTCASLLKTIGAYGELSEVTSMIMGCLPDEEPLRFEMARGLRSMGYPAEAGLILRGMDGTDDVIRERAGCAADAGERSEALSLIDMISDPSIDDDILRTEMLSGLRRNDEAVEYAGSLLKECPDDFRVRRCYCSALLMAERRKDAERYVRVCLKDGRGSADSSALAAHYMWVNGKTAAAGGYAVKAVKADPGHIPAMEILAYCMIEKGKMDESRIIAGAINEKDPGNPAAFRILDMCRKG